MFTYAKDVSNIRGISVTDTGTGAVVGLLLSGTPIYDASLESLAIRVHIEYGAKRQNEIDVLMQEALYQAMKAIQHEINLCQAKIDAENEAANS